MRLMYKWTQVFKRIKLKLINILWYKRLFHRFGKHTSIQSPFFLHKAENIVIGNYVSIAPMCRLEAHPKPDQHNQPMLIIGNKVRLAHGVNLSCAHSLEIEDDVLISGGAFISDNDHGINPLAERYLDQPPMTKPTKICKGAWVGTNSCVLKGAHIGERAIIGCNSVVTGDIPPYTIAVGSPAKVIRRYCLKTNRWVNVSQEEVAKKQHA